VVNTTTLLLVQNDLESLAAVLLGADTLADDLDGVNEVVEDGVVDSGQGARARTLLLLVGAGVDRALGAGQDAALSNEEDVAVGELLLELTGQAIRIACQFLQVICCDAGFLAVISYRCWILWKPWRRGTGTKMITAFLPWPTSTCSTVLDDLRK
jgi:hypothetical protein